MSEMKSMDVKVPILMYHRVSETDNPVERRYCCPPKSFRRQMHLLRLLGYCPIALDDFIEYTAGKKSLNPKSLVITLDDGYKDTYTHAYPILKEYGFPATVFLISNLIGRTNEWAQERGFPRRDLLDWPQIREMATDGVFFGSHTLSHVPLTEVSRETMIREIRDSKKALEETLGKPVNFFAYPYGKLNQEVKSVVLQTGFRAACSADPGFNRKGTDPHILRRIDIYGTDSLFHFILKIRFGSNQMSAFDLIMYYLSRLRERLTSGS